MPCKGVVVQIDTATDLALLREASLLQLMEAAQGGPLVGRTWHALPAYQLEKQLEGHPLVQRASVVKTWQGNLVVRVREKRLLARLLARNGERFYLDEQGHLIHKCDLPPHRCLVVEGVDPCALQAGGAAFTALYPGILEVLRCLATDPFLSRHVASLQVLEDQKLVLGTQVGTHRIEFGTAANSAEKLRKLKLFFKYVVPHKGWGAYRKINLMFQNQLVCS